MRVSLRLEVDVTEEQNRREATNTVTHKVTYFIYCSAVLMFEWSSMLGLLLAGT